VNRGYRTVWNAALGACVAVAEDAKAPRGGARGSKRAIGAKTALALAALGAAGISQAATFTVATEADLITAINAANTSTDPASTITITSLMAITGPLPPVQSNVTISNTNVTAIESKGGALLNIQAGATYSGAIIRIGNTAGTSGSLIVQGADSKVTGTTLSALEGQSNISVLDGGSLSVPSGIFLGGSAAATNGGVANVAVSGTNSRITSTVGYHHHSGTLEVSGGGLVSSKIMALGAFAGDSVTALVTGDGSRLSSVGIAIGVGAAGTATVTVAEGGTLSGNNGTTAINLAANATGVATLNIGAAVGGAAVAPGTVVASKINGGLGTAVVNFNHNASAYDFATPITGSTSVNHVGSGTTTLTGVSDYTGATNVAGGTLRAGAASVLSSASAHTVAAGGTLDLNGFEQTLSSLNNAGTVSLAGSTPGNTLTVTGAYVGNGGTLRMGTALGDSSSASDRLVLSGPAASATGSTRIQVTNLGGLGALTTGNGIEVVTATGGATTTAQSTKDAFTLANGHVDAGAYEYRLYAADASGAGENWYLRSTALAVPGPAEEPGSTPGPVPLYRAEVPMYAVVPEQFRELDLAMLGNLHQRVGDERVASSGSAWGNRQGWGRILSVDRDIAQQGTVSPTSSGRLTGFQAGTDLWANPSWRTGLYAGQLEGDMDVNGFARGVVNYAAGRNDLRSQYFGAYATWSQPSGLYIDNVLQGGRHRYTAYPSQGQASSGKGDSIVASIEVGQGFAIAPRWTIEPQLQLAYQRLSLDDTSITGASIQQDTDNGWIARAGVRIKGQLDAGPGALQPYARVNLYKRSSGTDITRFIGPAGSTDIASRTGGTSSELALGATWQLGQSTSLYGELGKLWDLGGDARTSSSVSGSVGVKLLW